MNERIQKLADQAEDCADADDKFPYPSVAWLSTFKEKFAELIVKECAELCEGEAIFAGSNGRKDASASNCSTIIKEHFGVEE